LKRVRQAAYVGSHPLPHRACAAVIRSSRLPFDRKTSLKYVGDHLALSLSTSQRREVLVAHYSTFPSFLRPPCLAELGHGITVWEKSVGDDLPHLSITLERSMLAPMEGELQLRFSFKTDLYVLTFSVGPGHVLGVADTTVLFIGGVQGRIGSREEVREAARLNSELSPRALLVLAAQALARAIDVDEIIAVGEDEHISRAYAEAQMSFDYAQFWTKVGGVRVGRHYRLPMESPHKPLALVAASHRSRARRRREIKHAIRDALDLRFRQLIEPRSRVSCVAETT
jgi:uncharacterized protein VirK/YbjX